MRLRIEGGAPLVGDVEVPADKSILHRALILGALAEGNSTIRARLPGADNRTTVAVLEALGVRIDTTGDGFVVHGVGPQGLVSPKGPLDCGNSGTTMRLMAGVLAGAGVAATLTGDASLRKRPMGRVCEPLRQLGADIAGVDSGDTELPPLRVGGGSFRGGRHVTAVASAQVKSAVLLAGLCSRTAVELIEPRQSRDHTERLLAGSDIRVTTFPAEAGHGVRLPADARVRPISGMVPGDLSSAAFVLAAGSMVKGSRLRITAVGVNPTRTGILEVLEELGADVRVTAWQQQGGEPTGTLLVEPAALRATRPGGGPLPIGRDIVPRLVDELVVIAALASQAEGVTEIGDAEELRVKESDRITETCRLLRAFGARVEERQDGLRIEGPQQLNRAHVHVGTDHRIALTAAVLALAAPGQTTLEGFEIADVSYPSFIPSLQAAGAKLEP